MNLKLIAKKFLKYLHMSFETCTFAPEGTSQDFRLGEEVCL